MSNQNPIRKGQAGQPTTNNGHFASKTNDAAVDVALKDSPPAAMDRYNDLSSEVYNANARQQQAAIDVFRQEIPKVYPGAVTAEFTMLYDYDSARLSLSRALDANGDEIDSEEDEGNISYVGTAFADDDDASASGAFTSGYNDERGETTYTLDLNETPQAPNLWAAEAEVKRARELRAKAEQAEFQAGATGIRAVAAAVSKDGVSVTLTNVNEEGGAPYLAVTSILDKDGKALWLNPDYATGGDQSANSQKVVEKFDGFAPLLDRDMSKLTRLTTGWATENTWSFKL